MRSFFGILACVLISSEPALAATQSFHRTIELEYNWDERYSIVGYRTWNPTGTVTFPTFDQSLGTLIGADVHADTYLRAKWSWDFSIGDDWYVRAFGSSLWANGGYISFPAGGDFLFLLEGTKELDVWRNQYFGDVGEYDSGLVFSGSGDYFESQPAVLNALQVPGLGIAQVYPYAMFGLDECVGHSVFCGPIAVHLEFLDEIDLTYVYTPTVPEPAAWGLMICGFAMVGLSMRRGNSRIRSRHLEAR